MTTTVEKALALLKFLQGTANIRRKRISAYSTGDKLLWLADIPRGLPETWKDACKSALASDNPADIADRWLEVRKKPKPTFPLLPEELRYWVPQKFQNRPEDYLYRDPAELIDLLNQKITLLGENGVSDSTTSPGDSGTLADKAPEVRRLEDYPHVQDAWLEYLEKQWAPWAQEIRLWQELQRIYEDVDFMRRRIEEAEERYELLLAIGLLQWRDSTGATINRHLLTAPAEISLDAGRGVLTAGPAASFEKFRVELDMLELQDRPHLEGTDLENRLEELDVRAWDKAGVAEILRIIANKASANSQVSEDVWKPLERADGEFRVLYAPALVLRERRPTAYEELISRFLKDSEDKPIPSTTAPWERFVSEGELSDSPEVDISTSDLDLNNAGGRLYFPLPTNDEQRQIAERLKTKPYVLVKGPPGTGKSHTIANLICHLLATGERVLVTAHAPKALTVLADRLRADIRNLCVMAVGSGRKDHELLEKSVGGILSQKNEWKGQTWAQDNIDRLEKELRQFEDRSAEVDRQLRECREVETHAHSLPGGYRGTAGQIARRVEKESETYHWFPELPDDQNHCPLLPEDIPFLADIHVSLAEEHLNELRLETGTFSLPDPGEFAQAIERLNAAEREAQIARAGLPEGALSGLKRISEANLDACRAFLSQLEKHATRACHVLGELASEILKDMLVGRNARWDQLAQNVADIIEGVREARTRAGSASIDLPSDVNEVELLPDTQRRLEHFRDGGKRGYGFLAPRVVRETRYIEQHCRIDGKAPRELGSLETLLGFLKLKLLLRRFHKLWPRATNPNPDDPRRTADEVVEAAQELNALLEFFRTTNPRALDMVPIEERIALAERDERSKWQRLIESELACRRVHQAQKPLEAWRLLCRGIPHESAHPCLAELAQAIDTRDLEGWSVAWHAREKFRKRKSRFDRYQELLAKIQSVSPELERLLRSTQGDPEWTNRFQQLEQAWAWAAAKAWLRKITDPDHYMRLAEERKRLQENIEKKLAELAALKAWKAFFARLDDQTEQNLRAWAKAVARIGKGTGKYAYRHRRTARQYLMACITKMPAWIMPLHKLWETTEPTPGVFDTVIVDEASQAGIEALALLLLAKRIVVVGDDKQNSPERVGVLEDDIARLARDHLREFRFRDEFRPDTSLYDHAERAFGNLISLREHFRCVPEIIRFSNELCYTDAPLIPLRQPPPNRLPPLKSKFVPQGACEGEGQRIINRAEAEAIVDQIQACLGDKAYEGKTMGVIVLQGRGQAEFIETKLAEALEPGVREQRKLRCGVPATFQGDQRDVIFLSLVVAPNHRFRALTGLADQRRFNVAMSRARDQVWLLHSVQEHDLSRDDLRWQLLHFFSGPVQLDAVYEELDRLEREALRRQRERGSQPDPYESWFEVDVTLELLRRRYKVRPQYEVAGYRIDLVVEGLFNRLAVECDGEAWHGPERFEQDVARQRQLERAGWTFVRIRESEFYANRERAVRKIIEACDELEIRPIGEEEHELEEEAKTKAIVDEARSERQEDEEEQTEFDENEGEAGGQLRESASCLHESDFPDPRNASPANVRAALRRIIEQEGPLTKRYLFKLYVTRCPDLHRAGKAVKERLNRALHMMQKEGEVVVEDELGDRSLESQVLRLPGVPMVRERQAGQRDLLDIPPSEFFLVLDRVSRPAEVQDDEALARRLLAHYGFSRLTQVRRRYLKNIIEAYERKLGK